MKQAETLRAAEDFSSALCLSCGLCCDGTLFFRAPVAPSDDLSILRSLEARGVTFRLDVHGGYFEQPCACLEGKRCGVYPHRPATCGDYKCQLLQSLEAHQLSLDSAQERVAQALEMVVAVRAEAARVEPTFAALPPLSLPRRIEALAQASEDAAQVRRRYAKLLMLLLLLHRHLRLHFEEALASPQEWAW